jgi:hypothetical protein
VSERSRLSPRAAVVIGLLCAAAGVPVILASLGFFPSAPLTPGTPPWVGILAGMVFVLAGVAMIVGYAVAGAGPDGDLPPGTSFGIRVMQLLLGLGVTVSLAMIGTWIALGGGPRKCEVTGIFNGEADDTICRVAFGVGALLTWVFTVVLGVVSYRRLRATA